MKKLMFGAALAAALSTTAFAELPTAAAVQKNMGMGFNIGNSMEVPNNPTAWGNPYPTQALLDSIKAAGFNTVRIPCAWDSHAPGGRITETWLDSVKTVVDYAMRAGLYTVLNIHHEGEGGWFQSNIGTSVDNGVDTKMKNYWTQIANKFKNYDEHLIFAGANEPGPNIETWTPAHVNTLMHYYQTFIDAVRATGGNNASRTLVIQGLNTDIDKSVANVPVSVFPKDKIAGRLMFEVHYYDPYQYTLMDKEQNWGAPTGMIQCQYYYGDYKKASEPKRNAGYNAWADAIDDKLGGIGHPNEQFAKMKSNYADKGYPVLVGEFGANVRSPELSGADLALSKQGRVQWHKDVVTAAKNYGLTPVLWDMGNEGNNYDNMAYIRRQTNNFGGKMGQVVDPDVINAMRGVYGLGNYVNNGITHREDLIPGNGPVTSSSSELPAVSSSSDAIVSSSSQQWPQSSSSDLPAVSSSSEWPAFSSSSEGTLAINVTMQVAASLTRQGNLLIAQGNAAEIRLFDMNGNLVREVRAISNRVTLSLAGLNKGMYMAKSGSKTIQVRIK